LHVAVMQRRGVGRILSYDRDFDRIATIERVY
jgi:predicted nucleic acid-binding protein